MTRYSELDFLRGIAVLMMVIFHLSFDLHYFYGWNTPAPLWFAWATASLFLMVIGICFMISWEKRKRYKWYVRRGLFIFFSGMIITLVTWIVSPENFVQFGILHLIGMSAIIQPLFAQYRKWNLLIGCVILFIGCILLQLEIDIDIEWLFPLGLISSSFISLDYYPLIPWFGVVLIGMGIGSLFYAPNRSSFLMTFDSFSYPSWILWMGRKALWIYFLHQPVILALLKITTTKPNNLIDLIT